MRSLEEIKEEYAKESGFGNWNKRMAYIGTPAEFDYIVNEVTKRYAKEVAKEALKNANSKLRNKDFLFHDDYELAEKSILSESNIPNLL